jgi:hypothetical protein
MTGERVKSRGRSSPVVMAAILYLVLLIPAYGPFLFGGKALYQGDIFLYFEPALRYMAEAVKSGRLPLWNPLCCGGLPQIAIISPGLFYLPNLLFVLMPFGAALGAVLMLHQWLAGLGGFLFLRASAFSISAATVGGAAIMLSGYMFGSSQCYTLPVTFAWTPLCLYLVAMLVRTGRRRWAAWLALAYGMQILGGRPELFLSAALIYLGYAASVRLEERQASRALAVAGCLASLALGAGMAAAALLPVLELFSLSPRASGLRFGDVALWSAGWFDWLQVILTRPFGDLVIANYDLNPHYPGLFPYISSLFLGAPAVTLALFGYLDRTWRGRWFWLAVALLFFLLALGKFGPLLPALYQLMPGAAVLRYPIKVACFVLLSLAIACAAGWDAAASGRIKGTALKAAALLWFLAAMAGNVLFLDIGGFTGQAASDILGPRAGVFKEAMVTALRSTGAQLCLVAFLGLLVMALVVQLGHGRWRKETVLSAFAFVVVFPLLANGPGYLWHMTEQSFYEKPSPVADWLLDRQKTGLAPFRMLAFLPDVILSPRSLWRENDPQEHSILQSAYERQILEADTHMDFGLSSSYGFMPTDTRAFMMLYVGVCSRSRQYADSDRVGPVSDAPLYRFCQLTNTKYLVTLNNRPNPLLHVLEPMPVLDPALFKLDREVAELNARLYEIPAVLPRAYFRERWEPVSSQVEALKHIFWAERSGFDPRASVLINREGGAVDVPEPPAQPAPPAPGADRPGAPPDGSGEGAAGAQVMLETDTGERVTLTVDNPRAGFLVLADTHYPGWKAYDGGAALTIYQANGFQKAVWLEPGRHAITFEYRPYSLFWGGVLALASLLAALTVLVTDRRPARDVS